MAGKSGPAQARRRARRAQARQAVAPSSKFVRLRPNVEPFDVDEFRRAVGADSLTAAASGGDFPLSAQDAVWDSGEASKAWQSECGIGGDSPDWAKFHTGYFWYDSADPEKVTSHKLPFVDVVAGKPTAVWKGVTSSAGGHGVDATEGISAADKTKIKANISGYYAKAAEQYKDPSIEAPWDDEDASIVAAAGDIAWAPEEGFQDLLCDVNAILNPSGDWDYPLWACDVSTDLTKCLIANWDDGCGYYVAPLTVDPEKEPVIGQRSEWVEVEQAWVESDDGLNLRAQVEMARSLRSGQNVVATTVSTTTGGTLTFQVATSDGGEFDGATDPDIPPAHQPTEKLPPKRPKATAAPITDSEINETSDDTGMTDDDMLDGTQGTGQASMSWTAVLAPEGSPTDDGRIFAPGAISWRELPLSLGAMLDTPHADVVTASPVVGRIDEIWRDGDTIYANGVFDNSDLGREIARMVTDGTLRGVSVDIAVSKMEIAWRSEVLDEDGVWAGGDGPSTDDGPDLIDILFDPDPDDQVMYVVWEGTIGAVTICPFPAFAEANIKPAASLVAAASEMVWTVSQQAGWRVVAPRPSLAAGAATQEDAALDGSEALTASLSAPEAPPAGWFDDPELGELTALTIDDDGRVYGHAAPWDACHIGIPGVCTTAPRSETGYAYFHLKEVECDDGARVSCGTITLGTGHAHRNLGRVAAAAHYDDTGTAVADVVCGEDEHGIWYSGAVRPHLDAKTVREFRGAALSGDWRNVNGHLEFIALLAVNVPGFPVPKARAMVASGERGFEVLSLTAAGIHRGREGLTRNERAWFDALRDVADGGWDEIAASLAAS